MAVYTHISKDEIVDFLQNYKIKKLEKFAGILEGVENSNYKIITSTEKYILTIFEKRVNSKDLPFFINLKNHLVLKNFYCPKPVVNNFGKSINYIKNKPCVLTSYLEGKKLEDVNNDHCYQVGSSLSLLHQKTQDFHEFRKNSMDYNQWNKIFLKCKKVSNNNFNDLLDLIKNELSYLKKNWPKSLPKGIVHGDLFKDNVFFTNNKISGFIDFYFACNDYYAYDLAITANAWCFEKNKSFNEKKFYKLIEGYQKNKDITKEEINYFQILCRGAAVRILITRLHDELFKSENDYVEPKNPIEFADILKFHQNNNIKDCL